MRQTRPSTEEEYARIHQAACEFIEDRHGESDIMLRDFCFVTKYSRRSVQRAFKEGFNITWTDLLTNRRLVGARKMLLDTDDEVKKIARRVGYRSSSQFAKAFKAMYGKSPREYRRVNRLYGKAAREHQRSNR